MTDETELVIAGVTSLHESPPLGFGRRNDARGVAVGFFQGVIVMQR
jgi:hypothetical protein